MEVRLKALHWVSISPTFYELPFHMKAVCVAFLYLKFGFIFFWRKKITRKAALKMLLIWAIGMGYWGMIGTPTMYLNGVPHTSTSHTPKNVWVYMTSVYNSTASKTTLIFLFHCFVKYMDIFN
jgi:hypothetical protein